MVSATEITGVIAIASMLIIVVAMLLMTFATADSDLHSPLQGNEETEDS